MIIPTQLEPIGLYRRRLGQLPAMLLVIALQPAFSQGTVTPGIGCTAEGYRVVAQRWDAALRTGWEFRQNCVHPEWPSRVVPSKSVVRGISKVGDSVPMLRPLLVHAGDQVRLWAQSEKVRVEMSGAVEQSGRNGDHVMVQIRRNSDELGSVLDRIAGIVRGVDDVEMER